MEEWRDIKDYPDYEISNLGRVKSLSRVILHKGKYPIKSKEKILKAGVTKNGYLTVSLCTYDKKKTMTIHKLVAMAFLNHTPCKYELVVNHINFNRKDNRLDNLEIVTNRENSNKKHLPSTSQYVGVSFNKNSNKWMANIWLNGKLKYLGLFENEIEASKYYEDALASSIKVEEIKINTPFFTSTHKGVSFHKTRNKWLSRIYLNGKLKYLGLFHNEEEAGKAYQNALNSIV